MKTTRTLLWIWVAASMLLGCQASDGKEAHESAREQSEPEEGASTDEGGAGEEGASGGEGAGESEADEADEGGQPPEIVTLTDEEVAELKAKEASEKDDWPLTEPRTQEVYKTTTCSIYMTNLDSRISGLEKALAEDADKPDFQRSLAEFVYFRGQLLGDLAAMVEGLEAIDALLEANPEDVKALLVKAQILQSLHRVDEAQAALDAARALEPEDPALASQQQALKFMTGQDLKAVLEQKKVAYEAGTTFDNYVSAAQAYEHIGEVGLADCYYGLAERFFEGVAPIPLAWLNVQRGLMAMHAGDYERAHLFFDAGYARCPEYPMAAEHLAEIEGRLGNTERAVELYEGVIEQTNNPEFMAALGELYQETGREAEATALFERADARNRELIEAYPEAMYWHASDFYLGPGADPALGLELLEKNLALRPTARAHQALAEAQLANDQREAATETVAALMAMPAEFAEKHWTAARVALANGDAEAAATHEARARELNPRIEAFEDPLPTLEDAGE